VSMGGGVLVSQPVHQHAYELVVAAQKAHALSGFVTGIYVRDPALRWLPNVRIAVWLRRQLRRRWHPEVDPRMTRTIMRYGAASLIFRPLARRISPRAEVRLQTWAYRSFDRAVSRRIDTVRGVQAVHAFEGTALATLERARALGKTTILDVPSAYERILGVDPTSQRDADDPARIRAERSLADYVIVPSAFVADCLVEHGVSPDAIVQIPYGVDVRRFRRTERRDATFRVLFVGQVSARKGVSVILDAWRQLSLPRAELVLVGRMALSAAERRELPADCILIGQVPKLEVHKWFASADVFAFPSYCEGSALVTYEAMAAGLPVVTTHEAGSVVRDGIDGYVIRSGDPSALAERLASLYVDRELRLELGCSARERVASGYTWNHYHARIGAFYQSILGCGVVSHEASSPVHGLHNTP
jgi:starch synthase